MNNTILNDTDLLGALVITPFIGAVVTYLLSGVPSTYRRISGILATIFSSISFVFALALCVLVDGGDVVRFSLGTWIEVGDFKVDFLLRLDQLSAVMALVITGVGTLIHCYAIGYMDGDQAVGRFFAYLNLFLSAMLILVTAGELPLMFVGWEGVGVCSYLLIGFWYRDMANAKAGQKAFVVNRIGDLGFLLGMFLLYSQFNTLNIEALAVLFAPGLPAAVGIGFVELVALCLFIGAVGKSAQIPLFVWLPDAMAGPTPVSALIHAATMVTAGVYLLSRLSFLYVQAPIVMSVVAVVGVLTAFVAATIALVQTDIKKVLAYSTVSQLGFMFLALGYGAFSTAIFHVVTHAFFKACLFMSAGSVILGCHHEQDMRRFGGLAKRMPYTAATYFAATLAIAGFPFTSGFYSKDEILLAVYTGQQLSNSFLVGYVSNFLFVMAMFTALLTAFYMMRSFAMTFLGEYRGHGHPHESSRVITVPLVILAILSLFFSVFFGHSLQNFLHPWVRPDLLRLDSEVYRSAHHVVVILSSAAALLGIGLAAYCYTPRGVSTGAATGASSGARLVNSVAARFKFEYGFLSRKWYFDELFDFCLVRPLLAIANLLFLLVDRVLIDGTVNALGYLVDLTGGELRSFHRGRVASSLTGMFVFTVLLLLLVSYS